jgi:hypothetical protein
MMELMATCARLENDGFCTVLSFADDPVNPQMYVILQIANNPSPQDVLLGHNGIYFEVSNQIHSGYNLVKDIQANKKGFLILLDEQTTVGGKVGGQLQIYLETPFINGCTAVQAIEVFSKRLADLS